MTYDEIENQIGQRKVEHADIIAKVALFCGLDFSRDGNFVTRIISLGDRSVHKEFSPTSSYNDAFLAIGYFEQTTDWRLDRISRKGKRVEDEKGCRRELTNEYRVCFVRDSIIVDAVGEGIPMAICKAIIETETCKHLFDNPT